MKFKNLVSTLAALTLAAPFALGQYSDSFNVLGIVNPGDDDIFGGLSATVAVDFLGSDLGNGLHLVDRIEVTVTNTGPLESSITGFYLKKPVNSATGDYKDPDGFTAVDPLSDPSDWAFETSLAESLKNFYGNHTVGNYFGASSGTRLDYPDFEGSSVGMFNFDVDPFVFDSVAWASGDPLVFVRWQAVFVDDVLDDESGKGGFGPGFNPGVPEPSEVAALAVLGLGGILFVRRRFTKKQK